MEKHGIIQVAGVIDQAEANLLVEEGVRYLGFPLRLPVNREDLSESEAAAIIRHLRAPVRGVLITYLDEADDIIDFMESLGTDIVQLHGDISAGELSRLKKRRPGLTILKSLVTGWSTNAELLGQVRACGAFVDAFITDTYDPVTGATGATGKTHDWSLSRELVEASPKPVILAGGLSADNVREAIESVRPAGVDAHTGLEGRDGRKDRHRVRRFVGEAREAFSQTGQTTGSGCGDGD